jgi:hypothetical protein
MSILAKAYESSGFSHSVDKIEEETAND